MEKILSSFKEKNNHIFFEGQIYDVYSLLIDIFNKSKKEIIIIDNYIDKNILDILSKIDRKIMIMIIMKNFVNIDKKNKYVIITSGGFMKTLREEKLIRHNKILTIILIILVVLVSIIIGIIIGEYFATMSLKK